MMRDESDDERKHTQHDSKALIRNQICHLPLRLSERFSAPQYSISSKAAGEGLRYILERLPSIVPLIQRCYVRH
jgi:hypothetical protein